jgi:hypothetical protein
MKTRARQLYRNRIGLPLMLLIALPGLLVCARWIQEMRVLGANYRLSTQLRELKHAAVMLDRDINDLRGRESALVSEDALKRGMAEHGLQMSGVQQQAVIHLDASMPSDGAATH